LLGFLCKQTGGQLYYYPNFNAGKDGEKLYMELYRNLSRTTGFEGLMRVRTGKGLSVVNHYGHFYTSNGMELDLATLDSDKSILVELKHEDKIDERTESVIQVALLYP
jgi:protein transport protein SEC24